MATAISFDSHDLQTSSIITSSIEHHDIPDLDMPVSKIAHANRSAINKRNFPMKKIVVKGTLESTSVSALDTLRDTFLGYFLNKEANLDIGYAGGTRRYTATVASINAPRPGGLNYIEFTIVFVCTDPFGRATSLTTALTATGRTLSSYTDNHTFVGTAPTLLPVWTITINTVTAGANYLMVGNSTTGQRLAIISETFVDDDVLVIDCYNKSVQLNGEDIDFLGAFPEFKPGAGTMTYSDNFSARNFDILVQYYPLYQ
ncbi:MAG TPA: phage tail family protein [Candidatus Saccharibacteria bacterium]|nr:phage tail family protein [Candidatus Saccharibacteria bacterium]